MEKNIISEEELLAYRHEVKGTIFRLIHQRLKLLKEENGFSQEKMAEAINMDPGQLSRLLKGYNDPQIDTLSDLARALGCRIQVRLVPISGHPENERERKYVIGAPAKLSKESRMPTSSAIADKIVES